MKVVRQAMIKMFISLHENKYLNCSRHAKKKSYNSSSK